MALNIQSLYTGIKTMDGEKVYLGDKLSGFYYYPMLVQYDIESEKFVLTTTGKNLSEYRQYPIENAGEMHSLRVIHNTLIYRHAAPGDIVKITVDNIKDKVFELHQKVKVTAVSEWTVTAQSLEDPTRQAEIRFGEFLEAWRLKAEEED